MSMISIVEELKRLMDEKKISPETAALFIGASGREVRRWIEEDFIPNLSSRKKIKRGIRRIERNL